MTSWKTTVGGICAAIGTALVGFGDDATLKLIGTILGALGVFFVGTSARDNNVTSEQAKAGGGSAGMFLLPYLIGSSLILGAGQVQAQTTARHWLFEPDLSTGAVKIVENETKDGITANIFPAAGLGAAYRFVEWNADTKEWDAVFGVALDFFVGGEIGGQFNISPTLKAEFFDSYLQFGIGYDIGYVGDRSRVFGIISSNFGFL